MPTKLIISEKPQVAQKIAAALSDGKAARKTAFGVAYFEFSRNNEKILVSPAVGHVYTLRAKQKGGGYPVFDIEWAPSSEVDDKADYTKKYLDSIKAACKQADEVVNACDYDIEGSLIGGNIIRFACKGKAAKRMHFSTLTKEDLEAAYDSLEPLDTPQIDAGDARHVMDWYWGINSSRALMQAIRSAGTFRIMSVGRVQGPALAILASREKEISAFASQPYWELSALLKGVKFAHEEERFFDELKARAALADAQSTKEALVVKVDKQKFKQNPPVPFDLTSLQIEAHGVLGIDPSRTLQIAQTLYENAFISYPRTSSQKLSAKLGLEKIINSLAKNPAYEKLAKQLISEKRFTPNEGKKEDAAHPAIHPTGQIPRGLKVDEQKLYDLIARRFLSCFAKEALRERMKVSASVSKQNFSATGSTTIEEGWFEFYKPYLRLEEEALPQFSEGEKCKVEKLDFEQKQTQPPKRYTAASLIKKLESENLGTKATRAEIIETLKRRGYMDGKSFSVTPLGMAVFEALHKNVPDVLSEELTRKFEEEMDAIQAKECSKEKVISEGRETLLHILEKFKAKEKDIGAALAGALQETRKEQSTIGSCQTCKAEGRDGMLVIKKSKFGQLIGCTKYPDCKVLYPLPKNALVQPEGALCEKCGTPKIKLIRKGARPAVVCPNPSCGENPRTLVHSSEQQAQSQEQSDFGECVVCKNAGRTGRMTVKKSIYGRFLGCTSYPNCRALYPLPKDATAIPTGKLCEKCGAPNAKLLKEGQPDVEKCLNPKCETNGGNASQGDRAELGDCPSCKAEGRKNGVLVVKRSRFGMLAGCSNYPNCKQYYSIPRDSIVTPLGKTCETCGAPFVKVIQLGADQVERCLNSKCETNAGAKKTAPRKIVAPKPAEAAAVQKPKALETQESALAAKTVAKKPPLSPSAVAKNAAPAAADENEPKAAKLKTPRLPRAAKAKV